MNTAEQSTPQTAKRAPENRRYHPTAFAADYVGLSKRYLEALRLSGGGPEYVSFGKAVRYTLESLDAWAKSRARNSTSDSEAA